MHPSTGRGREPGLPPLFRRNQCRGVARVTSDLATAVTTGITIIISAAAATGPTIGRQGVAPRGEGHTATSLLSPPLIMTHCRLGLNFSHTGGEAMLNPVSI